jgi:hypothetical protein
MRLTLIFLTAFILPISCNYSDTTKVASETVTVNQQTDTTSNKSERQLLIEELKRLQAVFASKDKEKIADIFQFPLSDTTVGIYIDDSTFNAQLEKNGGKTTRAMFIRHFSDISESLQIAQINELFKKIDIDRLLQKDTLQNEVIIKTEPCYHYYDVSVDRNLVTLTVGTNSNRDYKSKSVSEDEIPENSSEFCDDVLWWVFRFDGKKLHFRNISGAG